MRVFHVNTGTIAIRPVHVRALYLSIQTVILSACPILASTSFMIF